MWWEESPCFAAGDEYREKPRQVRKVPRQQDIARFTSQAVAHPLRRIVWLQIPSGGQFRQCVAGPPEFLRGLPGAQLAAVPHDLRLRAAACRQSGNALDLGPPFGRERPSRIDLRPYSRSMMNEI